MFERKYEIVPNAPAHTSWDAYSKISLKEYRNLLETASDDETAFQHFFEENPSFVPGAFELFGSSGHYPYTQSLITQPKLDGGIFNRVPDFIWLAQDSLSFTPVLIEIEKPNKRTFTNAAIQSSDFTQALGQLQEWMSLLSIPENILQFYRCFDIPEWMKKKKFAPQYGLIYGRRAEYENNSILLGKRAQLVPPNVMLASFDRLQPDPKGQDLLCTSLSHGQYTVKTIPPTFRYSPMTADNLSVVNGFDYAITKMNHCSDERKNFLIKRYPYWKEYGSLDNKGVMNSSDCE